MNKNRYFGISAIIVALVIPSFSAQANLLNPGVVRVQDTTPRVESSASPLLLSAAVKSSSRVRTLTSPFKQLIDFNGDGKADVFWYNDKTGETSAWLIDGDSVISYVSYATVSPSTGWRIKGFGDFNGDGKTDIFWYNNETGETSAWLIDGGSVISSVSYSTVSPSTGWILQGFGDANGDGKTDIFWYNKNNGDVSAWLINGSNVTYPPRYGQVPSSTGWSFKGFGDADGDGKTDVFWFNYKTGETSAWLINGSNVTYPPAYGKVPILGSPTFSVIEWSIEGFGDFNGDRKTDIFWYNNNTGETSAWLIGGNSIISYVSNPIVPPSTGWRIKGYGDFNGDRKTDIFWYNNNTGETSAWLMDGGSVINYAGYGTVPPSTGWYPLFASQSTGLALYKPILIQ